MAYAVVADVREALAPEGSDQAGSSAASLSDAALQDAINEATGEIDAAVKGAPFPDPAPAAIKGIARDVAAYLASLTFRQGLELSERHPVALRYRRAQDLLVAASKGQLDFTQDPEAPAGEAFAVNPYEGDLFDLQTLGLGPGRVLTPWNDPWP